MKRDNRFDFYKGLLMIGVIWGHAIKALKYGDSAYPWIHLFVRTYDMPMFAFISGYFLKKSTEKYTVGKNLLNKVGGILVPILLWNIICNILAKANPFQIGGYWFLWSLFCCSCLIILVDGLLKKREMWKNFCFGLMIVVFHIGLGQKWKIGFLLLPCVAGYYFAKRGEKRGFFKNVVVIGLFVVLQCFWELKYNVWNAGVNIFVHGTPLLTAAHILYRNTIGLVGCFAMKLCFDGIYNLLTRSDYPQLQAVQNWTVTVGQNTLGLYILQGLFVENWGASLVRKIVNALGWNPFVFNPRFMGYCLAPAVTIFSIVVLLWIKNKLCLIPYIGNVLFGVKIKVKQTNIEKK